MPQSKPFSATSTPGSTGPWIFLVPPSGGPTAFSGDGTATRVNDRSFKRGGAPPLGRQDSVQPRQELVEARSMGRRGDGRLIMKDRALIRTFEGIHDKRFLVFAAMALLAFAVVLGGVVMGFRENHVSKSADAMARMQSTSPQTPVGPAK
jgi:hypothetical protein